MPDTNHAASQNVLLGCGLLALLLVLGLLVVLSLIINQERHAVRYPNAVVVPSLTKYALRPFYLATADVYRTPDAFIEVHNWYANRFKLTSQQQDEGSGCVLLEGTRQQFLVERYIFVSICETLGEQKIFVFHAASLK